MDQDHSSSSFILSIEQNVDIDLEKNVKQNIFSIQWFIFLS